MKKENYLKNSKGITLVALVVTVIVLLILASVTVASSRGNNGILTKSKETAKESIIKDEEEILQNAITKALKDSAYGSIDKDSLEEAVRTYINGKPFTVTLPATNINGFNVTFTESKHVYQVTTTGEYRNLN